VAVATAIDIGTTPFGSSSGGFEFKLDPATGLLARTTTSFGPSFVERALTAGEGKVSVGATFSSTNYDKLSDFSLSNLPLGSVAAASPIVSGTTTGNLKISSQTVAISGAVGVTPKIDIGVVIPLVTVKLSGTSSFVNGNGVVGRFVETNNKFFGVGDIAAMAKFRLLKFKGPDVPDPGGAAINVVMRLPTGDQDNLRGLDVTRTLGSFVVSFGKGPLKPHGSVGFEYWNKAVDVPGEPFPVGGPRRCGRRVAGRHAGACDGRRDGRSRRVGRGPGVLGRTRHECPAEPPGEERPTGDVSDHDDKSREPAPGRAPGCPTRTAVARG